MHKTLYIDVDEEITSIIDRVRAEKAPDVFLVVPKDAMLTEGVINLKLLKKEAEKLGKEITIATKDKHARKVIERVGFHTNEAVAVENSEIENETEEENQPVVRLQEEKLSQKATDEVIENMEEDNDGEDHESQQEKKQPELGSDSFYDNGNSVTKQPKVASEMKQNTDSGQKIPVSGSLTGPAVSNSRQLKDDLYAKKNAKELHTGPQTSSSQETTQIPTHRQQGNSIDLKRNQPLQKPQQKHTSMSSFSEEPHKIPTSNSFGFNKEKNAKKAEKFFSSAGAARPQATSPKNEPPEKESSRRSFRALKWIAPLLIIVVGLGAFGTWLLSNYPKVNVTIHPQEKTLNKEIRLVAKEGVGSVNAADSEVPGEYVEFTIEKAISFDATGETFESDDGKARGKVTIYNRFSSSPQGLVATTRVLSKEGKLFHLVEGVTVPGMDGENPGTIEVDVIANEPGADYNIPASTFTIEGFKGKPKYEKFEVKSFEPMKDGGQPDPNKKRPMVSAADVDNARKKTIDALEESLESEIASKIEPSKKILIDSIEKEIVSASSSHKEGAVASTFKYTVSQKIKAIAFNLDQVNQISRSELEKELESGYEMEGENQVTFKKGVMDLDKKTVTMQIESQAISWPSLDTENIVQGLVGKSEEEIKAFLSNYPEIEKVEITIKPSWLTSAPISKEKVTVMEIKD